MENESLISWNRYLYCRNDPFNYIDPDGRKVEPARIITGNELINQIYAIQQANPSFTPRQTLAHWNNLEFIQRDVYLQAEGIGMLNTIDIKHMLTVAEISSWGLYRQHGYALGVFAGHVQEMILQGPWHHSFYSPEDVPSNKVGAIFGSIMMNNFAFSTQLRLFLEFIGANMDDLESLETHRNMIRIYNENNSNEKVFTDNSAIPGSNTFVKVY